MTVLRFAPGDEAPGAAMFALVGQFGEPTGVAIWREQGEKLPHLTVAEDIGPFWFVQIGEELPLSRAA